MRCCADTPNCVGPHFPASPCPGCFGSGAPLSSISGYCAKSTVPRRRTQAAPKPQPCRTLAASALYLCRALVVGNRWLFRSSAVLGPASKADVLLEHMGWPTLQRDRSEREQALLASINNFSHVGKGRNAKLVLRGGDQALPLEVALGTVTLHHSKRRDCSPAVCSQQPACGLPGGPELHHVRMANRNRNRNPHPRPISTPSPALTPTPDSNQRKSGAARGVQRVCVLSLLYAQSLSQAVFVHKFAPGPSAAADGAPEEPRCLAAARALPHVQQLLQQFPGQFVPESRLESSAVATALRDRGDGLRRLHLQEFMNETAGKFPAPRAFELNLNAVRLWYREPKPCHDARTTARHNSLSEGEQRAAFCTEGAPRIAWSNLHTYEIGRGAAE